MTSLLVNIIDESKANDVVCFLKDIPFLEIIPQDFPDEADNVELNADQIRCPHSEIRGKTKIMGNIIDTEPLSSWNLP